MNPYPRYTIRPVTCLDGSWDFAWLGGDVDLSPAELASADRFRLELDSTASGSRATVPGCFDAVPGRVGVRGTAAYRTLLPPPRRGSAATGGRLVFDGLGIWAAVYVDGDLLHVHRKPYSSFAVDVPAAHHAGTRELIVVVDNRFDPERSPLQENYFDFYAYGGIFRSVWYHETPDIFLTGVRVLTHDADAGAVSVIVTTNEPRTVLLSHAFDGGDMHDPAAVDVPEEGARIDLRVPNPRKWSPDDPALHTLMVQMFADDGTTAVDDMIVRFGLRTVSVQGRTILINGEAVRLFGWNRHEAHAQFGPALPQAQLEHDLALMKNAGANFVRGSHYPQDSRFLDLCDETGVMVWEESIGWQQDERHFATAQYVLLITEQQRETIEAHANHPSIIMWGFQNELHSEKESARPFVADLARVTRETDPSRPVTFATCRFPRDLCLDLVDIISINMYPAWYAADADEYRPLAEIADRIESVIQELGRQGHGDKPLILSEIGAGAIYGFHDQTAGHWSEEYQSDHLALVCSEFAKNPAIAGLALWQFCDCRTYGSARALTRPRGFNNKGIVDEYRRPKLAYSTITKLMAGGAWRHGAEDE
jgi:beta-glucuronidase